MLPRSLARILIAFAVLTPLQAGARSAPPIEAFARIPAFSDVSLSPDGHYVAYITADHGRPMVLTVERKSGGKVRPVLTNDKSDVSSIDSCGWANTTRLVCTLRGVYIDRPHEIQGNRYALGGKYYVTRLVAVNADGSAMKVLIDIDWYSESQFQRVLDWRFDDPDNVLVELDNKRDGFPSIFELNVYSGKLHIHTQEYQPIRHFVTDEHGAARIGWGQRDATISYFARLDGDKDWRVLAKFDAFAQGTQPTPLAVIPGTNDVYATARYEGRDALWEVDLEDKQSPKLIAHHPQVDIDTPLIDAEGRLLGVYYETDHPAIAYVDGRAKAVANAVKPLLPGEFVSITDWTQDRKVVIIEATSDVDAGTYYVLDLGAAKPQLKELGTRYPDLDPTELGHMQPITYPARDGTEIPGYLTVPPGASAKHLPLIVMPHGGPIARTDWAFNFLLQFLVTHGYAVLQMNFRGSSGYGWQWQFAAHQDWGGLTYSDVIDGAHWAIAQGIADPKRMCIVGWSFGGYVALLGAARDSDLFRCAVSIAGVSDLLELEQDWVRYTNSEIVKEQIGTVREKIRADSPRLHADGVKIPILLVHGTHDLTVDVDQSRMMVAALKRADKPYEYVEIDDADHQIWREPDRARLLSSVEKFLAQNLGAAR